MINKKCYISYSELNSVILSPILQNIYMCLTGLESGSGGFDMSGLHVTAATSDQVNTPSNPDAT